MGTKKDKEKTKTVKTCRVAWMGSNRDEEWHIVEDEFFRRVVHSRVCPKCLGVKAGFYPRPFDVVITERPRSVHRSPHALFPPLYRRDLWDLLSIHTKDVVTGDVWLIKDDVRTRYTEYVSVYHKPGSQLLVRSVCDKYNLMSRCDLCLEERLDINDSSARICRRYLDGRGVFIDSCGFFVTDEPLSDLLRAKFPELGRRWIKVVEDVDDGMIPWREGAAPPPPGTTSLHKGSTNIDGSWVVEPEP
jgi:hypothetical protein